MFILQKDETLVDGNSSNSDMPAKNAFG